MSKECQPHAASAPPATEGLPPLVKRRVDRIDEPARPLGAKRAALQLRRHEAASPHLCSTPQPPTPNVLSFVSPHGVTAITLRATRVGLLVERTQRQRMGARLTQCMVFNDRATFDRWCEAEPLRFHDPVLHDQLRREGHEALGGNQ